MGRVPCTRAIINFPTAFYCTIGVSYVRSSDSKNLMEWGFTGFSIAIGRGFHINCSGYSVRSFNRFSFCWKAKECYSLASWSPLENECSLLGFLLSVGFVFTKYMSSFVIALCIFTFSIVRSFLNEIYNVSQSSELNLKIFWSKFTLRFIQLASCKKSVEFKISTTSTSAYAYLDTPKQDCCTTLKVNRTPVNIPLVTILTAVAKCQIFAHACGSIFTTVDLVYFVCFWYLLASENVFKSQSSSWDGNVLPVDE